MQDKVITNEYVVHKDGSIYSLKGNKLKPYKNIHGYLSVKLWIKGKTKNVQVHRVVAKAFIENKNNYPCVNHIDGDKTNNSITNLEWCSYSQNSRHAYKIGLRIPKSISKQKYISVDRYTKKWRVSVNIGDGIVIKGGRHLKLKDAILERNNILIKWKQNK